MCVGFVFFFKQKTAYEIPKRDWSSDVCSSDLDGVVHTVVATNGVVYVGGDFKTVCPNAGRGEVLNIFSAESRPLLPQANGGIFAVVADGSGGWFIAGDFTAVGGI